MQRLSQKLIILLFMFSPFMAINQISPEQFRKVDEIFQKWDKPDMPGCALAIVHKGKIIYKKGYGMADLEHDIPIQPNSIFYIGSVSKQFVAMCMLLLKEQGKLDLDADIRTYLPEFPDYGYMITCRNLIHHTSGIRDNLTLWELAGRSHLDHIPETEIYEMIKRQEKLNFEPGTEYRYSNSCYFMMSLIIERVSGQTLHEFADEYIFQKLGMKNSFFGDDNRRIIKNRAFGYGENSQGKIDNMIMRFDLVGSGGLYSSVEDLFLWDQNFYNNQLGERRQALIDEMLTNGKYKDGSEVDYAFAIVNGSFGGLTTISHSGSLGGYRAFYVQFPEQEFSVIILGNVTTLQPEAKAYDVARICLDGQFIAPGRSDRSSSGGSATASVPKPFTVKDLTPYLGRYYSHELDYHYQIESDGEQLSIQIGESEPQILMPVSDTTFRMSNGWTVVFQRSDSKKITGFLFNAGRVSGLVFQRAKTLSRFQPAENRKKAAPPK